jgi:hypothetical protein
VKLSERKRTIKKKKKTQKNFASLKVKRCSLQFVDKGENTDKNTIFAH